MEKGINVLAFAGSVDALMLMMKIKLVACQLGLSRVAINKNNELMLSFEGDQEQIRENIKNVFQSSDREFQVQYDTPITLHTRLSAQRIYEQAMESLDILCRISQNVSRECQPQ